MKTLVPAAAVAALMTVSTAQAGLIERACITSDRKAASRSLCGCIQDAADLTLSSKDQKLAASFFKDPHRAQVIRQSDNTGHEAFWKRYKHFGQTAEAYCK